MPPVAEEGGLRCGEEEEVEVLRSGEEEGVEVKVEEEEEEEEEEGRLWYVPAPISKTRSLRCFSLSLGKLCFMYSATTADPIE